MYLSRLLKYHQTVVTGSGGLPDELLYGRAGYLYALVFINQQLGHDRIPLQYIQQVSQMWIMRVCISLLQPFVHRSLIFTVTITQQH